MPTYDYRCPNGHAFELFQKMSEEPGAVCPECGADAERQLSGGAGFLFKGEGFYITDYRSESYRKAAEKDRKASEGSSSGSGSSGGSDSGTSGSGSSDSSSKSGPTSTPSGGSKGSDA
jgi:putative FmdB family regulatory protein